jgi:hypothetical protein
MQGERDFGFWGNLRTHVQKKMPSESTCLFQNFRIFYFRFRVPFSNTGRTTPRNTFAGDNGVILAAWKKSFQRVGLVARLGCDRLRSLK